MYLLRWSAIKYILFVFHGERTLDATVWIQGNMVVWKTVNVKIIQSFLPVTALMAKVMVEKYSKYKKREG